MSVVLRFLSLGAGVQSTTLALMYNEGFLPAVDFAIFADTGAEPAVVYEHLEWLKTVLRYPVYTVSAGNLERAIMDDSSKLVSIPFHTKGMMLSRYCTRTYKIDPIRQYVRDLLGLKKGEPFRGGKVEQVIGISLDEVLRVRKSDVPWIRHVYALVDMDMTRDDCLRWLKERGFRQPPKSACYFCPYKSGARWIEMKENHPEEFSKAVEMDNYIRTTEFKKRMQCEYELFLHNKKKPLEEIFEVGEDDSEFLLDECEGMCGV